MAERSRFAALQATIDPLQRVLLCVAPALLKAPRVSQVGDEPIDVLLGNGGPGPLRGPARLTLRVRLRVRLVQVTPPRRAWEAEMAAYEYALSDADGREIVVYHWHPDSRSDEREPHLHLGHGAEVGRAALLTAHLPTGPVALAAVVRLAIVGLGALPLRQDWPRLLGAR